ncbi:EPSP synthase (3-phosphoshikimate 1-carboxyvinyltransferase) [alpha proteobacterium HIMB5]|nr:EPSP synthase (3-phosphoshikimate 1-carboxyvinyltransferase) [alpha proteobacterium HIMB5]
MTNTFFVRKKIGSFKNKKIRVSGDKSISIRWVLFASLSSGKSKATNLLMSDDVKAALNAVKKLGIKVNIKKKVCEIFGKGIGSFKYNKKIIINAQNSGTLGRLIMGLLVNSTYKIKIIGDNSLSKRDFKRISDPLSKFGVKFILSNNKNLPLTMLGTEKLKPIRYFEKRGSAQCKSAIIFAGLRTDGTTLIKAKKSRNHTELFCKYLNLPVTIKKNKNYDLIKVKKANKINPINYDIPADISSAAFFIVLTILSNDSSSIIKNVNVNLSRIGLIKILRRMGAKIILKNLVNYKGEQRADIYVKSTRHLKGINCPSNLNSEAIDEFLLIFLVAARSKGVSYFKNLSELNEKESPRLNWGSKILNYCGVKNELTNNSLKIYGNPNLKINKKIIIRNYLKDHRIFMSCVVAGLTFGGKWEIHDKDSIKSSFPNFLKLIKDISEVKKKK